MFTFHRSYTGGRPMVDFLVFKYCVGYVTLSACVLLTNKILNEALILK